MHAGVREIFKKLFFYFPDLLNLVRINQKKDPMRKILLIVACLIAIPVITLTFSSCKKRSYTCVCDGNYYTVTAFNKSAASTSCNTYGTDCYIE
jgi:hypothetical protein